MQMSGNTILITGGGSGIGRGLADAEAILSTNLLGPMRLTAALLPHLVAQPAATLMTISSRTGLCAACPHAHLLRHQSRHSLLDPIASSQRAPKRRRASETADSAG